MNQTWLWPSWPSPDLHPTWTWTWAWQFEKDLIPNPTTKKDFILNKKVNLKIKYEKAIAFFKSGQADSIHHAAMKFGVDFKTMKKLVLNGGSFEGGGRVLKDLAKKKKR